MMTNGDKTCHWTIRKKGKTAGKKVIHEIAQDDALSALRLRFAKGELTPEQYRQSKDILLEKCARGCREVLAAGRIHPSGVVLHLRILVFYRR